MCYKILVVLEFEFILFGPTDDTSRNTTKMRAWLAHVTVKERPCQTYGMGLWAGAFMDKLNFSPE